MIGSAARWTCYRAPVLVTYETVLSEDYLHELVQAHDVHGGIAFGNSGRPES